MTSRTARSVLALLLVASVASAQEAPKRAWQVAPGPGERVLHPNWVYTPEGKERVDEALTFLDVETTSLRAQNESLRADLLSWEKKPALTWTGAFVILGIGVVVGGALVALPFALRR